MNTQMQGKVDSNKMISIAEIAYLLYFAVMFGARAVGLYEGQKIYNISLVIGMILFLIKILMTEHTLCEYMVIGCMLLISLVVYYNTGEKGLLLYFTMMLGMKKVSLERVFKLGTIILSTSFVVLVFLSVTGIKRDIIYIHERAGFGNVIRHSLGYPYPNTLFTTYIVLMVLIMYVMQKQSIKQLLLSTLTLLIGAVYIYIYSCSNTGLIVAVFYLLINLYLQCRTKLLILEKIVFLLIYPFCAFVSIVGPLITSGKLFQWLDKLLHNRWAYSFYYLTNESLTLFGVRFKETPNTNYMIDSSFLYSFLQIGVVPFILLMGLFLGMIYECIVKEKKKELAIFISFCLLGMSDPFWYNLSYKNLLFLFVGKWFYEKMQKKKCDKIQWLGCEVQFLKIGSKLCNYNTCIYQFMNSKWRNLKKEISENIGKITLVYLISAVSIAVVLCLRGWTKFVEGKIDQVPEWEYVRGVISISIWGSVLIVWIFMAVKNKKKNAITYNS